MSPVRILQAITSVRVGEGSSIGSVDLPLAREPHTRWPFLPGSSLKGALRARAESRELPGIDQAFGLEPQGEDPGVRGRLRVGDAVLLALPARTLRGSFVLLTCPMALARMARASGSSPDSLPELTPPAPDELLTTADGEAAICEPSSKLEIPGRAPLKVAILEDLDWYVRTSPEVAAWARWLGQWTGDEAPLDRLAIVSDDVFAHAVTAWTEVRIRNAIGPEGVVEDGKLFSAELAPPETLWWWTLSGGHEDLLPGPGETFVVGGWQSVGMGRVAWYGRVP